MLAWLYLKITVNLIVWRCVDLCYWCAAWLLYPDQAASQEIIARTAPNTMDVLWHWQVAWQGRMR